MVEVTDPKLGEVVLDPASGTGGFLVESFEHLPPEQMTESILKKEQRIAEIMNEIRGILNKGV